MTSDNGRFVKPLDTWFDRLKHVMCTAMVPILNRLCKDHGRRDPALQIDDLAFIRVKLADIFTPGPLDEQYADRSRRLPIYPVPWPICEFSLEDWINHVKKEGGVAAMLGIDLSPTANSGLLQFWKHIEPHPFTNIDQDWKAAINPHKRPWSNGVFRRLVDDVEKIGQEQRAELQEEVQLYVPQVLPSIPLINF